MSSKKIIIFFDSTFFKSMSDIHMILIQQVSNIFIQVIFKKKMFFSLFQLNLYIFPKKSLTYKK